MPVRRLRLSDFSAFKSADLEFVDGLNVFLGANSTGKTHILKLIYALLEATRTDTSLKDKLAGVFRPDDGQVGHLARRVHGSSTAKVTLDVDRGQTSFELPSKKGNFKHKFRAYTNRERAVFLPSREVLAMYEGFIAAYRERELAFDETCFDACIALNANPIKGPSRERVEPVLKTLREALGGQVELSGERFYVKFHGDKARMEAHLVAEGLRKVASLERLLLNGSLTEGGFLFWDEPEANLNPRLTVLIADVLGALASMGVQVFITTHDFLLARRLSVKSESPNEPATRFFLCHRPQAGDPVEIHHGALLTDLPENPIEEQFARHYDFEISRRLGGAP
jgi:hypothetical protein